MLIMWTVGLPRIRRVIEARESKISEDLADAESAKGKAEDALKAYEEALADARLQGPWRTCRGPRPSSRRRRMHCALSSTPIWPPGRRRRRKRIQETRAQALASLRDVAGDVARAATERLVGTAPSEAAARAAVEASMGEGR